MGLEFGEEKVIFGPKTKKEKFGLKIWGEKIIFGPKNKEKSKIERKKTILSRGQISLLGF